MSQKKGIMNGLSDMDDTSLLKEVGRRIAYIRISAKIKQDELAKKAGLSRYALSRLENGAGGIRLDSFLSVLRHLNVLDRLSVLLPKISLTPLQIADLAKKRKSQPKRVRSCHNKKSVSWKWGDEK